MFKKAQKLFSCIVAMLILVGTVPLSSAFATNTQSSSITVGNVDYHVQVGDEINYTFNLTTPNNIEDVQAITYYDSTILQLQEISDKKLAFPVLNSATRVIFNAEYAGQVLFNAAKGTDGGINFTSGGSLVSLKFTVISEGNATIGTVIQEMTEYDGGSYATNGEIVSDDVIISETLNISERYPDLTVADSEDFEYDILTNETYEYIEITGYIGDSTTLIIPDVIEDLPVASIGNSAFYECSTLESITIPNSVTTIGYHVFSGCSSLKSILIPDSVTSFDSRTFLGCSSLINVDSNNPNYSSIDGILFNKNKTELIYYPNQKNSETYSIPDSVTSIGDYAFFDCSNFENIIIPNSVTSIGDNSFYGCSNIKSITIPGSVKNIGFYAFSNCSSLANVAILNGVTSIGYEAFSDCSSLKSIDLPDSITYIDAYAFSECSSLESIFIPRGVTSIESETFVGCPSLINVDSDNPNYSSIDGVLYSKDQTKLIHYPNSKTSSTYLIPDSVTSIGAHALYDCSNLENIIIPNSVTSIDLVAILRCDNLESVVIPDSVTHIGYGTLLSCNENLAIYGYKGSYAESYANENELTFVPLLELTDVDSNIIVVTGSDADLNVEHITDISKIEELNSILENETVKKLYNITLVKDGVEIQPNGIVTVKIPASNKNSKIYRAEPDGKLTDMNAVYTDGYMVLTTDHFSLYALALDNNISYELGDVNLDSKINVKDATAIQKHIADIQYLSDKGLAVADFNADSKVNVKDATAVQKHIAGIV